MRRLFADQAHRRWAVALAAILLPAALGQLTMRAIAEPTDLGISAVRRGDEVLVSRVEPAGWAWDAGARPGDSVVAVDGRPLNAQGDLATLSLAASLEVRSGDRNLTVAPQATNVPTTVGQRLITAALGAALT